jgi:hypothetical protein
MTNHSFFFKCQFSVKYLYDSGAYQWQKSFFAHKTRKKKVMQIIIKTIFCNKSVYIICILSCLLDITKCKSPLVIMILFVGSYDGIHTLRFQLILHSSPQSKYNQSVCLNNHLLVAKLRLMSVEIKISI